MVKLLTHFVFM